MKSTQKHLSYWKNRKIDWQASYLSTWNHPHRDLIIYILKCLNFYSLWEIGVGGGANLAKIIKEIPNKQLGGSDVNLDAVETCREVFKNGLFHHESGEDIMMSDKSIDVILSDMTLIYVGPLKIDKYLKEMKRVSRGYIVLVEFHSSNWFKRQWARLTSGYHVYNYKKRLTKLGFYDILIRHIPEQYWPGTDNNTEFRSIIVARV